MRLRFLAYLAPALGFVNRQSLTLCDETDATRALVWRPTTRDPGQDLQSLPLLRTTYYA